MEREKSAIHRGSVSTPQARPVTRTLAGSGAAICLCDPGLVEDGGACIAPRGPCEVNPCTEPNRTSCAVVEATSTVCVVDGNDASCQCDSDYIENSQGECIVDLPPGCGAFVEGGDAYEPNGCAALATPIAPGESQEHTIFPAGDNDWFSFEATAGRICDFLLTRGTLSDAYL